MSFDEHSRLNQNNHFCLVNNIIYTFKGCITKYNVTINVR